MDAIWKVQNVLIAGINFLLKNTDCDFTVVCVAGNHSRITKKVHVANESGNSLEVLMYRNLALHFEKEKRIRFVVAEGYHTYCNIHGQVVRFHHGHSIRYNGGVGGIYIPVNKAINEWNKAKKADIDVLGHYHSFIIGSNFIVNGSLVGYNAFALSIKAGFERPQQAFFLIDSRRGRTVCAPIVLS